MQVQKRTFYVSAPGMEPLHQLHQPPAVGHLTDCGRPITAAWIRIHRRNFNRQVCRLCVKAAKERAALKLRGRIAENGIEGVYQQVSP